MIVAHIPAGILGAYAVSKFVVSRKKADIKKSVVRNWVIIVGATLPDFDLLLQFIDRTALFSHRKFLTHIPMTYVGLSLLMLFGATVLKKRGILKMWSWLMLGVLIHLVLDSYFVGVYWGWPFATKPLGLLYSPFPHGMLFVDWLITYVTSIFFIPELILTIMGGLVLLSGSVTLIWKK